jgi:hypothetical protein
MTLFKRYRTIHEITQKFRDYGEITIPKGTLASNQTALGPCSHTFFVSDFSWIPLHDNGCKQYGLIHDATFYGIHLNLEDLEEI